MNNETLKKIIKEIGWGTLIAVALTLIGAYVNTQLFTQSTTTRISADEGHITGINKALFGDDGTSGMSAKLNQVSDKVDYIYTRLGGK